MMSKGYLALKADTKFYVKRKGENFIAIAVTIDDFAVATKNPALYQELLRDLRTKYMVKDLGRAKRVIG